MAFETVSLFDSLEADDTNRRVASRQALALSHKRVETNLGRFLRAAQTEEEFMERLAIVQDDFAGFVTTACAQVGHDSPEHIAKALADSYRLAVGVEFAPTEDDEDEEDENGKKKKKFPFDSAYHESRRPRMCPYHNEVVNASLGTGDPKAGYEAMSQHAWSANHCQGGDYEGPSCKFKPEMVTQSFWDNRSQKSEERQQVIPQDEAAVPEAPVGDLAPATEESTDAVSDSKPLDTVSEGIPSDSGESGSEAVTEAPTGAPVAVEAGWKSFSHISGVNMLDPINQPGAGTQAPGIKPGIAQPGLGGQGGAPCPSCGSQTQNGVCANCGTGAQAAGGQPNLAPLAHTATKGLEKEAIDYSVPAPSDDPRHLVWQAPPSSQGGEQAGAETLGPYDQWMVKSNLARIHEGADPTELVATLRANGYDRVAAAVEAAAQGHNHMAGAEDPSAQNDDAGRLVSCPECGGDGKTANNKSCPKCAGKGKVRNFGDSLLDSLHGKVATDGITDLGETETPINKDKQTPTNPGTPEGALEDDGRWPTKRKDILVPIPAQDRSEPDHDLKEIGEKTTEQVELDSASPNDSGFYDGGETKGVGGTWHGDKGQANPVTSRRWPSDRV